MAEPQDDEESNEGEPSAVDELLKSPDVQKGIGVFRWAMDIYRELKEKDKVRITKGRYKGKTGVVSSILGDKCWVSLDHEFGTEFKDARISVSYCEVIDDK